MARTNVKNLGATLERIRAALSEISEETYKDIGEYVAKRVVAKARSGKTMISGDDQKLKSLSANYVKERQRIAKTAGRADSDFFSPKRSNLTMTGQYLRSIVVTKIDKAKRVLFVEATGSRDDGGPDNKTLTRYLAKQGRNIFGIDKTGRQVIKQKVLRALRNQLRSKLLRK